MKKSYFVLILSTLILWAGSTVAQTKDGVAAWKTYGAKFTKTKSVSLPELLENQSKFLKKDVTIEATISEVCQNKGCWMVVKDGDSHIRIEFKDYKFFAPWDSEGKKVKLQGSLQEKKVSEKAAKHMAEEMKNPPIPADKISEEQTITVFVAKGISIEGGSDLPKEQRDIIEGKAKNKEEEGHDHHDH